MMKTALGAFHALIMQTYEFSLGCSLKNYVVLISSYVYLIESGGGGGLVMIDFLVHWFFNPIPHMYGVKKGSHLSDWKPVCTNVFNLNFRDKVYIYLYLPIPV